MPEANLNRIAEARKAKGWTQQQLGDAVGAHWITVSKLERGKMQLTQNWLERLAAALDVEVSSLLNLDYKSHGLIDINGRIHDRGELEPYERENIALLKDARFNDALSVWLEFAEDSSYPYYKNGDLIRFISVDESEVNGYIGHLALVQPIENGRDDQRIVGFIETGPKPGLFNLRPIVGRPHFGIKVHTLMIAYEVRFLMPWEAVRS